MTARCGWCLTNDHEHHRAGGQGWTCECPACSPQETEPEGEPDA